MAFCTNCGSDISPQAVACPQCGQPTGATVSGVVSGLEFADFWTRFGGAFIDWIILLVPTFIFSRRMFFGGLVIDFLYHWLLVSYWDGQTLGKRVVGVRVARPDGSPVDAAVAAARAAVRIVSGLVILLGFIWAAWDPEKRTWHDMAANTRVFRVVR